tara:strand:+ start:521 stop:829 length:309 start_codon:yes stop_codon:yes gene_type:complete
MKFWTYNKGKVRLDIQAGERITIESNEQTEEGYSASCVTFELSECGQWLTREIETDARDCDGRLESYKSDIAAAGSVNEYGFLVWRSQESWQRDQYAELMNY